MARQRAAKVLRVVMVTVSCPYCGSTETFNTDDYSSLFHDDATEGKCLDCTKKFFVPERIFAWKD